MENRLVNIYTQNYIWDKYLKVSTNQDTVTLGSTIQYSDTINYVSTESGVELLLRNPTTIEVSTVDYSRYTCKYTSNLSVTFSGVGTAYYLYAYPKTVLKFVNGLMVFSTSGISGTVAQLSANETSSINNFMNLVGKYFQYSNVVYFIPDNYSSSNLTHTYDYDTNTWTLTARNILKVTKGTTSTIQAYDSRLLSDGWDTSNYQYYYVKTGTGGTDSRLLLGQYWITGNSGILYRPSTGTKQTSFTNTWTFETLSASSQHNQLYSLNYISRLTSATDDYPHDIESGGYYYKTIQIGGELITYYFTDNNIIGGIKYALCINGEENVEVGQVGCAEISFSTNDASVLNILKTTPLTYQVRQRNDGATWRTIGIFYIDSVDHKDTRYSVKCYDAISKFDTSIDSWITSQSTPLATTTLGNWFNALCDHFNLSPLTTTFTNSTYTFKLNYGTSSIPAYRFSSTGISGRQMLQWIAGAAGGYIIANTSGNIEIKAFSNAARTSDNTINSNRYVTKSFSDLASPIIDKVKFCQSSDDIGIASTLGAGTSSLLIIGNMICAVCASDLTEAQLETSRIVTCADNIYNNVSNYSYYAAEVDLLEDYGLKAGDTYYLDVGNSVYKKIYIFSKEMSNSGTKLTSTVGNSREIVLNQSAEINDLRGQYNKLTRDVTLNTLAIGNMSIDIADLDYDMNTTGGKVSVISQTINGIDTRVVATEGALSNEGWVKTDISSVNQRADSISATVTSQLTTINGHTTQLSHTATLTADHGLLVICGPTGETVEISGGNINLDGHITFGDLAPSTQTLLKSGSTIRQTYPPTTDSTGAALAAGLFWYINGIPTAGASTSAPAWTSNHAYAINVVVYRTISGLTSYYICKTAHTSGSSFDDSYWTQIYNKAWLTYNGSTWDLTSNPYYIKSTYIDATTIMSPTIVGNDMIVDTDGGGAFKVRKDGSVVGFMGSGIYQSSTQHPGIVVSSDANGNGWVETGEDAFLFAGTENASGTSENNPLLRIQAGNSYIELTNSGIIFKCGNESVATLSNYARFG